MSGRPSPSSVLWGHLASAGAYTIFGLNIVFCKDIAHAAVVPPRALFLLRMAGAGILFWLLSVLVPEERRAHPPGAGQGTRFTPGDLLLTALASVVGLMIPQLTFLEAIAVSTPVDVAIMSSIGPVMTMFIAAVFLREPVTWKKVLGVALSFAGVLYLIRNSVHAPSGVEHTGPAGFALLTVNALSFAAYLGIFRPLIMRYTVTAFMKWMFLFALVLCLPFCLPPLLSVDLHALTPSLLLEIGYLVVFATFVAYFLIPLGQQRLRPTLVSMYTYLQPIIATVVSVWAGQYRLSWQKVAAALLVFLGVAVVNRSRSAAQSKV